MIAQRPLALISYNDSNRGAHRDYALAKQLATYLRSHGIDAEIKSYSASTLNIDTQWLIFIPSPEIMKSPYINKVVDTALDRVVKRHMKGVLAVTASTYDLPSKWATICKYDASDPSEEKAALEGTLRAMQYAKVPYPAAKALAQREKEQQETPLAASRREKTLRTRLIPSFLGSILLIILIVTGIITGFTSNPPTSGVKLSPSSFTATAQTQIHALATKNALAATDPLQAYNIIIRNNPTIVGFRPAEQWSITNTGISKCTLITDTYVASIKTTNQYMRCMAAKTNFTNFALQVTMIIQGDSGGVIFRDDGNGTYYRFAFNQSNQSTPGTDSYSVYRCNDDCSTNFAGAGTQLALDTVRVDRSKPITLTIIAQGNNIDLYFNKTFLTRITGTTPRSGQIGVFAASLGNSTDVTFINLEVWSLDNP